MRSPPNPEAPPEPASSGSKTRNTETQQQQATVTSNHSMIQAVCPEGRQQ